VLLQDRDDLFFRKAIALHALVLSAGQNELQAGLGQRGKVSFCRRDRMTMVMRETSFLPN